MRKNGMELEKYEIIDIKVWKRVEGNEREWKEVAFIFKKWEGMVQSSEE